MRLRLLARQRAPHGPRRQRGFSRFEFAVAAAVFAALVGIAANRLNLYQQQIESVAAEQLIATLRVALQFRISHLTAEQRQNEVLTIADENPIEWLSEKPKNYLGEYYSPDNKKLTRGSWYFDRGDRTLVYLLSHQNSFAFGSSILLKFKVKSPRLPLKPVQPDESGTIDSMALVQVFDE
jgi:hypothetical protein